MRLICGSGSPTCDLHNIVKMSRPSSRSTLKAAALQHTQPLRWADIVPSIYMRSVHRWQQQAACCWQ